MILSLCCLQIIGEMGRSKTNCDEEVCVPLSEMKYYTLNREVYLLPAEILPRFNDMRNLLPCEAFNM